jgi:hypothetical protein
MNPAPSLYSLVFKMHRIILIDKNTLNKIFLLNKSRTFEDIQKTIKMNLTKVRDKREGAG